MSQGEKKHTVLCVDDEENILKALKRVLRKEDYTLLTANSAEEGLEVLKETPVHLVLSDQRMPGMDGTEFLAEIKELYPETIRIILSGYTEIGSITESINKGHIYKFFLKPWNDENLKLEISKALDQYDLIRANKALTQTIIDQNEELRKANDTLESTVRERTRNLELKNQALELSQAVLEDLPFPVLCIGSDEMIVLINQKVKEIFKDGESGILGCDAESFFSENVLKEIRETIRDELNRGLKNIKFNNGSYDVYLSAMSDRFKGQGIIVSFIKVSE